MVTMAEGGNTDRRLNERVQALLHEVVWIPGILFVMGKGPQAVMEGWVDTEKTRVSVREDWVSVESEAWHCHLHLTEIVDIRFVEEPDVHDTKRQAFSIRLPGRDNDPLLMIFFGQMYDNAGVLLPDKVARFRILRDQYGL